MKVFRACLSVLALMSFTALALGQELYASHTVQPGDTLFRVALTYGIDMNELARANEISDPTRIFVGQVLMIPGVQPVTGGETVSNPLVATAPISHTVRRGESLGIIAQRYGVTIDQILRANNIPNMNRIYPGQVLQIWASDLSVPISEATQPEASVPLPTLPSDIINVPEPEQVTPSTPQPAANEVRHVVRQGEYLSQIARNYGVTWTSIAEANNITDPNRIYAGMTLRIPNARASAAASANAISSNPLPAIGEPGPRWGVGREIVVVLSTQMTYAYEDGVLQRAVLVSTGLPATPTVQGDYKIYLRRESQTMSGPGYYLPNVQWVQYFYQGYGLHGTYWHNNFGRPMSRGCVNMTNEDAEWFYRWADIGTPVHVRWS